MSTTNYDSFDKYCAVCNKPIAGIRNKLYCSSACRQNAYRMRKSGLELVETDTENNNDMNSSEKELLQRLHEIELDRKLEKQQNQNLLEQGRLKKANDSLNDELVKANARIKELESSVTKLEDGGNLESPDSVVEEIKPSVPNYDDHPLRQVEGKLLMLIESGVSSTSDSELEQFGLPKSMLKLPFFRWERTFPVGRVMLAESGSSDGIWYLKLLDDPDVDASIADDDSSDDEIFEYEQND